MEAILKAIIALIEGDGTKMRDERDKALADLAACQADNAANEALAKDAQAKLEALLAKFEPSGNR